jgi:excisionase family DNA binding protein
MKSDRPKFERDGHPTAVLCARETAAYLAVSESTVQRMVRRGDLPHIRMGEVGLRFRLEDLDAWLADRATRKWTPAPGRGPGRGRG